MKADNKKKTITTDEEVSNKSPVSDSLEKGKEVGTFLYYLPRVLWRRTQQGISRLRGQLTQKSENAAAQLDSIASIKKLSVDELEEIARSAGLNHLVGLSKTELVEQLWEHYSVVLQEKKATQSKTEDRNKDELYKKAQELDIVGRSHMSKEELKNAVDSAS